jgi:YVTN family beta-propeller protein
LTTTITVGNGVGGMAVTPNGQYVYSTNRFDGTVSVISASSNTVVTTITVGQNPIGLAITPNGEYVYVTNYGGNTVSVISAASNTVTATITGLNYPEDVAVSPNGEFIYVKYSYDQNQVLFSVISTATNTASANLTLNGYPDFFDGGTGGIAVAPNGEFIYVSGSDWTNGNLVSVISTASNTVTETIILGGMTDPEFGGSSGVAVSPNGQFLYATSSDWTIGNSVSEISTATNTVTETIARGGMYYDFGGSGSLAVTPNGEYIYASNGGYDSNSISVIRLTPHSTYSVTVTQSDNGQILPGTSSVNFGDTPTYTITPNSGYHIASISVNGEPVTVINSAGQEYQFSEVSDNGSISASFAINTYAITVTQADHGTISPETTTVNYGSNQEFTFTPATGYHIADVLMNGTSVLNNVENGAYTVSNVTGTTTLTATYAINTYAITVTQADHGTISPETTTVNYGDSQQFTITPRMGYHISSLVVDGSAVTVASTYTFSNVQDDHSISASFTTDTLTAIVTTTCETYPVGIDGNVTTEQFSNMTITPYQDTKITSVDFTLTGPNGTEGFCNLTLPKIAIPFGTNPVVYIDGIVAENQSFTEGFDNFYIAFTTHFSTHQIEILFTTESNPYTPMPITTWATSQTSNTSPNPTTIPTPTIPPTSTATPRPATNPTSAPATMGQYVTIAATIIILGAIIIGLVQRRKRSPKRL